MVVPAAATAAFLFAVMVMMTAAAATAATAAAACMTLDADGFEGLFDLGDLETDHAEHLGDVRCCNPRSIEIRIGFCFL